MASILDGIISSTPRFSYDASGGFSASPAGPVIVGENHSVPAGARTAGGCANLNVTNGRVAMYSAGAKAPWHKLGVRTAECVGPESVLQVSGTDWTAEKRELTYQFGGETRVCPGVWGIVRSDTGDGIGSVGDRYKVFQNAELVELAASVVGDFGAKFETAGALGLGERVWYLVHMPKSSFSVNGSDRTEAYALFTNAHDGTGAVRIAPTSTRVVCQNTYRVALRNASGKGLSLRHTGDIGAKADECRKALGIVADGFKSYAVAAEAMTTAKIEIRPYANGILDEVLELTQADAMAGVNAWEATMKATNAIFKGTQERFAELKKERSCLLEDILGRYESEKNGLNGMRGSVWSGFNAVTESADYGPLGGRRQGTPQKKEETRFDSVLTGRADEVKQIAFSRAVKAMNA